VKVQFWGTRGSISRPSRDTINFGGNTSCIEVRTDNDTLIVLDCGTGAWELGRTLLGEKDGPRRGYLLIGHTHWDHIQGFPFFGPLFAKGWQWDVFAPGGVGGDLEAALRGQMSYEYFPIALEALNAWTTYHDLMEGEFQVGPVKVRTRYLNHPAVTLGYRLEVGGCTVVYAADHEPHVPTPLPPGTRWLPSHLEDRRHIDFLAGADLVIHDTQYTEAEYPQRIGWGHTPIERAVDSAIAAGAKRLALFHHDPARTDAALETILDACHGRVARAGSTLEVIGAAEGQSLEIAEHGSRLLTGAEITSTALRSHVLSPGSTRIVVVDQDHQRQTALLGALRDEGYLLSTVDDGGAALAQIRRDPPALVIVTDKVRGRSGIELCQELRHDPSSEVSQVPVLYATTAADDEHIATAYSHGVTDYLLLPFKSTYLRARVRSWLLRGV
jgi:phosphoribosyl 1,2-cyclic phosphodiesterase/CheY-like chemotaxis protein